MSARHQPAARYARDASGVPKPVEGNRDVERGQATADQQYVRVARYPLQRLADPRVGNVAVAERVKGSTRQYVARQEVSEREHNRVTFELPSVYSSCALRERFGAARLPGCFGVYFTDSLHTVFAAFDVCPSTVQFVTDSSVYSLDAAVPVASAMEVIACAEVSVSVTVCVSDWPTGVEANVLFAIVGGVTTAWLAVAPPIPIASPISTAWTRILRREPCTKPRPK